MDDEWIDERLAMPPLSTRKVFISDRPRPKKGDTLVVRGLDGKSRYYRIVDVNHDGISAVVIDPPPRPCTT
jgi:hypothetical protein